MKNPIPLAPAKISSVLIPPIKARNSSNRPGVWGKKAEI
jgi:hypothetical protein